MLTHTHTHIYINDIVSFINPFRYIIISNNNTHNYYEFNNNHSHTCILKLNLKLSMDEAKYIL